MHKIPTLSELHQDNPDAFANDQLKTLLNMPPNQAWIKKHPISNMPYMPVDKVDHLLDRIYGRWEIEIKSITLILNSIVAVITLKVWDPVTNDWTRQDGTGAMPIQMEKESKAADMSAIKSNAVQLAAPAAVSYAKKDAADNLGTIFGRNVARKDIIEWDPTFKEDPFNNDQVGDLDKTPPPPPALPAELAAKVVTNTPLQIATPAPVFSVNAFAAPVISTSAPITQPAVENQQLDF